MTNTTELSSSFPDFARDIRLNLQSVLENSPLTPAQRWGVAVAAAAETSRLRTALATDAEAQVGAAVVEDALAAATLMAMTNVFYRFRHLVGRPDYEDKPARLRMNRLVKPATNRLDFELFALAVSAVNGCESCVRAHEQAVREGGLTEDHVHDAIRIASVVRAAGVAERLAA